MEIYQLKSPYIRRKDTTAKMMTDLIIALVPVIVYALVVYQWAAVRNLVVSVATMVLAEYVYVLIKNPLPKDGRHRSFWAWLKNGSSHYTLNNFLVPTVSGLLYGLISPASYASVYKAGVGGAAGYFQIASPYLPWADWFAYVVLVVGALFGIVVSKLLFGGTGKNIFNPAAVAFVFAKEAFGENFRVANYFDARSQSVNLIDVQTGPTFLSPEGQLGQGFFSWSGAYTNYNLLDMFLGRVPGLMGEACRLAVLLGLAYLLIRHTVDWRIVVSFLGTFSFLMLFAGIMINSKNPEINPWTFLVYELMSGGVLFGATFMITDPVTSPMGSPNRILYGMIIAVFTVFIRLFGRSDYVHEGMAFSILIGNMLVPLLDYYKWSSPRYVKRNVIPMVLVPLGAVAIVLTVLGVTTLPQGSSSSTGSLPDTSTGGTALGRVLPHLLFPL